MISKYDENNRFDYENGFYLTSETYRLGNILAHYELYKKILNLPGDVIELGVFKGASIIQFGTFRELLENEKSRKIIGFDVFGQFPPSNAVESDHRFVARWNSQFADEFLTEDDLYESFALKKISNVDLIRGDISETLPRYLSDNPHTRIALLHIDTDVYEPAATGLLLLYERVVNGGIIIFDDYATVEGETLAIDEFFGNTNITLHKFPFSHCKPSYIIKK